MPKLKEMTQEEKALYTELKKLGKRANQRIVRLEREFGKDTWATRDLKTMLAIEPLQAWTSKGRVKYNKSMTATQMMATIKEVQKFLSKPTSTRVGVRKAKEKSAKALQRIFSSDTSKLTYEEAEALEHFFEDDEVNGITNYIPGSDFIALIETAREMNYEYQTFYSQIKSYQKWNKGKSFDNLIITIYKKYIYSADKIIALIDSIQSENEINDVKNIIENLKTDGIIDTNAYNDFIAQIEEKANDIL